MELFIDFKRTVYVLNGNFFFFLLLLIANQYQNAIPVFFRLDACTNHTNHCSLNK